MTKRNTSDVPKHHKVDFDKNVYEAKRELFELAKQNTHKKNEEDRYGTKGVNWKTK